jgi:RNA polymerase sigma-70 factor (ECF subfamily)
MFGTTLTDGRCSPFDQAAQQELRERVEACLREVPEAFRSVVVLREIEGFTYEEIAEILQVNLGTVKSRLTRGRAVLRELLAPEKSGAPRAHAGSALDSRAGSCPEASR